MSLLGRSGSTAVPLCDRRLLALIVGIGLATAGALVAHAQTASAKWGPTNNCYLDQTEGHHCYAESEWYMEGYPTEYVDGSVAYMDTTSMNVPGWEGGAFVSNEIWVAFRGLPGYMEAGQVGGNGEDCCTLHRFYSGTTDGKNFYEYDQPGAINLNEFNNYYISDPGHNAVWGIYWGPEATLVHTYSGLFPAWSSVLIGGAEAAANTQPTNRGFDEVASVWPPNDTWHAWASITTAKNIIWPGMCGYLNPESPNPGSIRFGVGTGC